MSLFAERNGGRSSGDQSAASSQRIGVLRAARGLHEATGRRRRQWRLVVELRARRDHSARVAARDGERAVHVGVPAARAAGGARERTVPLRARRHRLRQVARCLDSTTSTSRRPSFHLPRSLPTRLQANTLYARPPRPPTFTPPSREFRAASCGIRGILVLVRAVK